MVRSAIRWKRRQRSISHTGGIVANTYASSSSSRSPTPYYVTHLPLVIDYDDDYHGEAICDGQEYSLTTAMMLFACEISQRYSTPTNNRLRTSLNTRNQAVVQADRVDIQRRNVGNGGRYMRKSIDTQGDSARNGTVLKETVNGNGQGFYETRLTQEVLLMFNAITAMPKDEAGIILTNEQNDFLLEDASKIEEFEDLSAAICMMA
ncbi:hypothetical protein Tco_0914179 [Tanacetum coccineum]